MRDALATEPGPGWGSTAMCRPAAPEERREARGIPFSGLSRARIRPWRPGRDRHGRCGGCRVPRLQGARLLVPGAPRLEHSSASHAHAQMHMNWRVGAIQDLPKILASGGPCRPRLGYHSEIMRPVPPSMQGQLQRCANAWLSGICISSAKICKGPQRGQGAVSDPPVG